MKKSDIVAGERYLVINSVYDMQGFKIVVIDPNYPVKRSTSNFPRGVPFEHEGQKVTLHGFESLAPGERSQYVIATLWDSRIIEVVNTKMILGRWEDREAILTERRAKAARESRQREAIRQMKAGLRRKRVSK